MTVRVENDAITAGIAAASTRRPQTETRALRPLVFLFMLGAESRAQAMIDIGQPDMGGVP